MKCIKGLCGGFGCGCMREFVLVVLLTHEAPVLVDWWQFIERKMVIYNVKRLKDTREPSCRCEYQRHFLYFIVTLSGPKALNELKVEFNILSWIIPRFIIKLKHLKGVGMKYFLLFVLHPSIKISEKKIYLTIYQDPRREMVCQRVVKSCAFQNLLSYSTNLSNTFYFLRARSFPFKNILYNINFFCVLLLHKRNFYNSWLPASRITLIGILRWY